MTGISMGHEPEAALTVRQASRALRQQDSTGYWYIGTVYSKHPRGINKAANEAALVTGHFIKHGVRAFSPICHTHGIAFVAGIDPYSHDVWMPADLPMMQSAHGLVVVMMQTWKESRGLREEIDHFTNAGKPVVYVDPDVDGWLSTAVAAVSILEARPVAQTRCAESA